MKNLEGLVIFSCCNRCNRWWVSAEVCCSAGGTRIWRGVNLLLSVMQTIFPQMRQANGRVYAQSLWTQVSCEHRTWLLRKISEGCPYGIGSCAKRPLPLASVEIILQCGLIHFILVSRKTWSSAYWVNKGSYQ